MSPRSCAATAPCSASGARGLEVAARQLGQRADEPAGVRVEPELLPHLGRPRGVRRRLAAAAEPDADLDQAAQHVHLVHAGAALDLGEHREVRRPGLLETVVVQREPGSDVRRATCGSARVARARSRAPAPARRPGAGRAGPTRSSASPPRASSAPTPPRPGHRPARKQPGGTLGRAAPPRPAATPSARPASAGAAPSRPVGRPRRRRRARPRAPRRSPRPRTRRARAAPAAPAPSARGRPAAPGSRRAPGAPARRGCPAPRSRPRSRATRPARRRAPPASGRPRAGRARWRSTGCPRLADSRATPASSRASSASGRGSASARCRIRSAVARGDLGESAVPLASGVRRGRPRSPPGPARTA